MTRKLFGHNCGRKHNCGRSQCADERRRDELRSGIRIRRGEHCSEHAETDGRQAGIKARNN